MEQILKDYSWDLEGYMPRASQAQRQMLTIEDAESAYQLIPSPPRIKGYDVNDYIRLAQETRELKYIFFYLHEKEWYFNERVHGFLSREPGSFSPYRFMDLKLECRMEVLRRFQEYDPNRNASFLTYMCHFITDAMLRNRITEENYSFDSLYDYKSARRIMLIYNDCKGNTNAAIRIYAKKYSCTEETAAEKMKAAWEQRNRLLPEINEEDDEEEPYEELLPDEWNYVSILEDGIEAEKIDKAFRSLSYRDQMLLEKRNAICMRCGRVSDMKTQVSFEKLAEKFEGSGTSGAERAYKRAVEKLMLELVKLGQLHCVRLKQLSVQREGKKITAAVYAYQVDNGGEWGEIQFDLEKGTAWVETFAENDPCDTWEITDVAIQAIMKTNFGKLPTRIIYPGSKQSSYELASRFFEKPGFSLHHVYRALDVLDQESDFIQSSLYKRSNQYHPRDTSILYYDCTNYFFEIEEEDAIRKYGKSKEHRPNPIVQMGLFLDADGIPLAYRLDSGNTNEQKTLKPLEKQIIQDFGEDHFIVCTDAGLASSDNRAFNSLSGRGFVVTQSLKQLPAPIQEWALEHTGWKLADEKGSFDLDQIDEEKYKKAVFYKEQWVTISGVYQRMVVTYSIVSRDYQRRIRERQISQAQKTIDRNKEKVPDRSQNDYRRFIQQSFFTKDGEVSDQCRLHLDMDIAQKEAMFDGFYAVCTNLKGPIKQILAINRQRWEIEESFRIMKTEFKSRPVFLSREQRIRAHFLTCFIALLLYRLLEKIQLKDRFTCEDVIDHLRDCEFCHLDGQGFIPIFTPDELFNAIQESSNLHLDTQLISYKYLKSIKKSLC